MKQYLNLKSLVFSEKKYVSSIGNRMMEKETEVDDKDTRIKMLEKNI
jgi:hypothetical protein